MTGNEHAAVCESLPEFLRGELTSSRSQAVRDHLAGCPECAAEAEALGLYMSMPEPDPGAAFWDRLPQAITDEVNARVNPAPWPASGGWRRWWDLAPVPFRSLVGAATLAALILLLALPLSRMGGNTWLATWDAPARPVISLGLESELLARSADEAQVEGILEIDFELTGDDLEMMLPGTGRPGLDSLMLDAEDLDILEAVLDRMGEKT